MTQPYVVLKIICIKHDPSHTILQQTNKKVKTFESSLVDDTWKRIKSRIFQTTKKEFHSKPPTKDDIVVY